MKAVRPWRLDEIFWTLTEGVLVALEEERLGTETPRHCPFNPT